MKSSNIHIPAYEGVKDEATRRQLVDTTRELRRTDATRMIDVERFNAKRNGVSDDTASFNTAKTALSGGGTIGLVAGSYALGNWLHDSNGITVEGVGAGDANATSATILKALSTLTGTDYVVQIPLGAPLFRNNLRHLMIDGNGVSRGVLLNGTDCRLEDVSIRNCVNYAVFMDETVVDSADGGGLFGCRIYGATSQLGATGLCVDDCYFNGAGTGTAIVFKTGTAVRVTKPQIESFARPIISVAPAVGKAVRQLVIEGGGYITEGTDSQVIGTDGLNYVCILAHLSAAANKPITGADWATYWRQAGAAGGAWASGKNYYGSTVVLDIGTVDGLVVERTFFATQDGLALTWINVVHNAAGDIIVQHNWAQRVLPIVLNVGNYAVRSQVDIGPNNQMDVDVKFDRQALANMVAGTPANSTGWKKVYMEKQPFGGPPATGSHEIGRLEGRRLKTTDATPVVAFSFPMEATSGMALSAEVLAYDSSGNFSNTYHDDARATCTAALAGALVDIQTIASEGNVAASCVWQTNAAHSEIVELLLTGVALTNITWVVNVRYQYVRQS